MHSSASNPSAIPPTLPVTEPLPPAAAPSDSLLAIERVRYPIKPRQVQLMHREAISPGFVRLTLGGEDLSDFASAGFDDHIKLMLPQPGQDRPSPAHWQDGRMVFDGPRPILRDYTPLWFDAARQTLVIDVALHAHGPASDWARSATAGQWVGVGGPRGSRVVPVNFAWHVFFGDESALPAITRRLAELPAHTRAVVRLALVHPEDRRDLPTAAPLDLAWVDDLPQAAQAFEVPPGEGYIWGAGEHHAMAALREVLWTKPGVHARNLRVSAYWKRGEAGHHEDLVS